MGLNWTNKIDGVDDVIADDVNSLANAIIENEGELEKKADKTDTYIKSEVYTKGETDNALSDKVDKIDVYTKSESLDKFVPRNIVSGYSITLTDHLADVPLRKCVIYGASGGVGDLVTSGEHAGKYKISLVCRGKNLFNFEEIAETAVLTKTENGVTATQYTTPQSNFPLRLRLKPNTTYMTSFIFTGTSTMTSSGRFAFSIVQGGTAIYFNSKIPATSIEKTFEVADVFTTPANISEYQRLILYADSAGTCTFTNIQIETGSSQTEYEPYINPLTTTIYVDAPLYEGDTLTVDGITTLDNPTNIIEATTSIAPSNIEVEYYQDIDKVIIQLQKVYETFGVSIDLANSDPETAVTYTNDAVGMTAGSSDWNAQGIFKGIKPCLFKDGAVVGYLNPDNFAKFTDGGTADITSGNAGDVMIEIPKLGVKISTSGTILTVQVTDNPNAEGFNYYAHTRNKEGDRDKLYIGAFLGSSAEGKLRSLSGKSPLDTETIGNFRTLAQANGQGYDQFAFYPLTLLQCLFLIKYKNRDSQSSLGMGYVGDEKWNFGAKNTGATLTKGMDYGSSDAMEQMKFLGIEDFWGNLYQWIDGLVSSSNRNMLTAFTSFNDTGDGYMDKGQAAPSNVSGYMKEPQGTTETGFITKTGGGSSSTYFADSGGFFSDYVPIFGGNFNNGAVAGAFRLYVRDDLTIPIQIIGGRLMYL